METKILNVLRIIGLLLALVQCVLLWHFYFFNGDDPGHTFTTLAFLALGTFAILKD